MRGAVRRSLNEDLLDPLNPGTVDLFADAVSTYPLAALRAELLPERLIGDQDTEVFLQLFGIS